MANPQVQGQESGSSASPCIIQFARLTIFYTDCQLHVGSFSPALIIWVSDSLGLDSLGGVATWRALLGLPDYQRTLTGQSPRAPVSRFGFLPNRHRPLHSALGDHTNVHRFVLRTEWSVAIEDLRVVDRGSCQKRAYGG